MSDIFGNSFKRELGKNTAKTVSNWIFGDSWSTPYRRTGSRGSGESSSSSGGSRTTNSYVNNTTYAATNAYDVEKARIREESEMRQAKELKESIAAIAKIAIPETPEEAVRILYDLTPQMAAIRWNENDEDESLSNNGYSDAVLQKYTSCLLTLKRLCPNCAQYEEFHTQLMKSRYTRNCTMYHNFWGSGFDIKAYQLSNEEIELGFQIEELKSFIETNFWKINWFAKDEVREFNKNADIAFSKLRRAYTILKKKFPFNSSIASLKEYLSTTRNNKFWRKNMVTLMLVGIIFIITYIILAHDLPTLGKIILHVSAGLVFVGIGALIWRKKKKQKEEEEQLITQEKPILITIKPAEKPALSSAKSTDALTAKPEILEPVDDRFIDLDEGGRISKTLTNIWNKYAAIGDKDIMARKPIFSADGVKDSILFVGVNPSYCGEEEKMFIHSEDNHSLLYGSFYQRQDAPDYFKQLEQFAAQLNRSYSHINLLYVPENDRNKLLKMDSEFIREQLELTYDTIIKIHPVAIVFFSKYCKNLIMGEDRWVNPIFVPGEMSCFKLKGTDIPVFFEEDITKLPEEFLLHIIDEIKDCIK